MRRVPVRRTDMTMTKGASLLGLLGGLLGQAFDAIVAGYERLKAREKL